MDEDHLMNVIEITKLIYLKKQIVEQENEVESDGDDIFPEVADLDTVMEEVREPEESVCKNPSRARDKYGVKGR
ncbi:hypothetical protein Tco_0261889 [Tanacetum coccineum]